MKPFAIAFAFALTALGAAYALEVGDIITRRVAGAAVRDIHGGETRVGVELVWKDEKKRENAHATVSVATDDGRGGQRNLIVSSINIENLVKIRDAFDRAVKAVEAE